MYDHIHFIAQIETWRAWWPGGRESDSESRGPGFDSEQDIDSPRVLCNTWEAVAPYRHN